MIIAGEKKDVAVSSAFVKSSFSIQASAKAFEILSSNIYTNKVRAVIREISCNAHDSHIAAKNPNPFKVHLPTWLEPVFSVRDFGIGLDDQSIREIYTTYFFSTKSSSNEYIGALGLGSKSPFCLVDSFTVTSWKDGIRSVYSCYKDENGEPQIANLTSQPSDEPNGVEVSLSVEKSQVKSFQDEAVFVFRFFENLPLINDNDVLARIESVKTQYQIVKPDYAIHASYGTLYAVMGNVAYEIGALQNKFCQGYSGYVRFNIGELSFDPGRENLSYDKATTQAVENKLQGIANSIAEQVIDDLNKEPNEFKRSLMAEKLSNLKILMQNKTFRDMLPKKLTGSPIKYYYRACGRCIRDMVINQLTASLLLYRYKRGYERRIKEFLRNNGGGAKIALITDEHIAELNIPDDCLKDLETLPRVSNVSSGTYKVDKNIYKLGSNGKKIQATTVPADEKVYVELYGANDNLHRSYAKWFAGTTRVLALVNYGKEQGWFDADLDIYMVRTAVSKTKAFKADSWIRFDEFCKRELDKKVYVKYNVDCDTRDKLRGLFCMYEHTKDSRLSRISEIRDVLYNECDLDYVPDCVEVKDDFSLEEEIKEFSNKYPMLEIIGDYAWKLEKEQVNSVVAYLDMVDNQDKGN